MASWKSREGDLILGNVGDKVASVECEGGGPTIRNLGKPVTVWNMREWPNFVQGGQSVRRHFYAADEGVVSPCTKWAR